MFCTLLVLEGLFVVIMVFSNQLDFKIARYMPASMHVEYSQRCETCKNTRLIWHVVYS